jgi:hypothetical protein
MKFLNKLFNWLCGIKDETENIIEMKTEPLIIEDSYPEYEDWFRLEQEKYEAINKCKGCKDKVFVLKKDGEDIAYAPNIYRLALKSKIPAKSLYRAYKANRTYKKIYEVTKLE